MVTRSHCVVINCSMALALTASTAVNYLSYGCKLWGITETLKTTTERISHRSRNDSELKRLERRVNAIAVPIHFCVQWAKSRNTLVSPAVVQAGEILHEVLRYLDDSEKGQDKDSLTSRLNVIVDDLSFAMSSLNLAINTLNLSSVCLPNNKAKGTKDELSPSCLLRASHLLSQQHRAAAADGVSSSPAELVHLACLSGRFLRYEGSVVEGERKSRVWKPIYLNSAMSLVPARMGEFVYILTIEDTSDELANNACYNFELGQASFELQEVDKLTLGLGEDWMDESICAFFWVSSTHNFASEESSINSRAYCFVASDGDSELFHYLIKLALYEQVQRQSHINACDEQLHLGLATARSINSEAVVAELDSIDESDPVQQSLSTLGEQTANQPEYISSPVPKAITSPIFKAEHDTSTSEHQQHEPQDKANGRYWEASSDLSEDEEFRESEVESPEQIARKKVENLPTGSKKKKKKKK